MSAAFRRSPHGYDIPVWATFGTLAAVSERFEGMRHVYGFDSHDRFAIGALEIEPITVPHDAREPVQYVVGDGARPPGRADGHRHVDGPRRGVPVRLRRAGARMQSRSRDARERRLSAVAEAAHRRPPRPSAQRGGGANSGAHRHLAARAHHRRAPFAAEQHAGAREHRAGGGVGLSARMDRHRGPGDRASTGARCKKEKAWNRGRSSTRGRPRRSTRRTTRAISSCTTATTCRRSTASSSPSFRKRARPTTRSTRYVMGKLAAAGIPTHFVRLLNERESLVKAMKMIPVECVVRNVCAGSMAKRYGIAEGTKLAEPIFEFFLKSDALHDPLCNEDHVRVLGWASAGEIAQMKKADPRRQRGAAAAFRRRRHRPRRLQARIRTSAGRAVRRH